MRFCVLVYKGIRFFIDVFLGIFIPKDNSKRINDLRKKTNRIIKEEKLKQERIARGESILAKKGSSKFVNLDSRKKKGKALTSKLDEKKRKKLEKLAKEQKNGRKVDEAKQQALLEKLSARARAFKEKINNKKLAREKKLEAETLKNENKQRSKMHKAAIAAREKETVKELSEAQKLKEQAKLARYETKAKARHAKDKQEEEILKEKLKSKKKKSKKSDSVTLKKVTFDEKISNFIKQINEFPKKIEKLLRDKWNNTSFAKNRRNKLDLNRQALLVEFNNKSAERSDVKMMYEYVVKDQDGKILKGYADGFSKVEIHSYLLSEGYEVYSIRTNKWIQALHGSSSSTHVKIKIKDLIFFATQLSTYLKSGITLIESLKILSRQYKNKNYKKIFKMIIYDLSMGENLSKALENRGVAFPNLFITMVKTSEMTGELPEVLDDMADYYTETEKTRKQMITAMMYPSIVFVFAICVLTFIMIYVIPKFVNIYDSMDGVEIPGITKFIIGVSNFTSNNIVYIGVGVIVFIILFRLMYTKNRTFRTFVQWSLMHIPVINNIIIYKEVTMFTKTFSSLLAHNVFITDSMEILSRVTQNEIYRSIIVNTVTNLARGERLSAEFDGHWAFPIPAYEMIVTGERTGQLPEMMAKVAAYYQELHQNSVTRIKTFIEPVLIVFLTGMVGVIVLSIVLPMFNMYQAVQQM